MNFGFLDYFRLAFQARDYHYAIIAVMALAGAVFSIMLHEIAHGYAAWKAGDPTAKYYGRLTLNPLKHFDLFGFACFVIIGFGWAKPVPVNDSNFRNYRKGLFWVAISGVLTNFILAFVSVPLANLCAMWYNAVPNDFAFALYYLFQGMWQVNLLFIVFNLLPIYPLDGFRVVEALGRGSFARKYKNFMYEYGTWVLLAVLIVIYALSFWPFNVSIFGTLADWLGTPILWFWNLIF